MINNIISVIIPVYNSEKNIGKCIESLCNQTIDNYEIILIDDGSYDNTEIIINKYMNRYDFIKYYKKNNGGVSSARNYGLNLASGKYIIFIDSDDWCEKKMLEIAYNKIEKFNVDWVVYGYYIEFEKKIIDKVQSDTSILAKNKFEIGSCIKLLEEKMLIASPWTSIYKASILKDNNIKFNENLTFGEDVLFNLEYLECVESIYILDVSLYHYVKFKKDTLSSSYIPNRLEKIHYNLNKRIQVYNKFNMISDEYSIHFANMFVKSLYGSVINMFHKNCELKNKEKLKSIKNIMSDEKFKVYVNKSNINNKIFRIFKCLYKSNSPFIMYSLLSIINQILKIRQILNLKKYEN